MRKRILSFILCVVLCLSLLPTMAFAQESPSMQNVRISSEGYLSWDSVPEAAGYYIGFINREYSIESGDFYPSSLTGITLKNECDRYSICDKTGDYTVVLYAYDSDKNHITETWTGTYHYVMDTPQETMPNPTNLHFEGSTAKWDAVPNARYYIVMLFGEWGNVVGGSHQVTGTQYDFNLSSGQKYKFWVCAVGPTGYKDSEAYSELYTYNDTQESGYTVTFDMNGHGYQIVAQSVNEGDKAVKPDDPIDNIYNWRFDGWYVDKSCSTKFDFDSAVNTDITLYAKWTRTYSIDINSVSYGAVTANKTRAVAGEKVILSPTPSAGCLLMDLKVTDRNNVECVLSKAGDDYIFTMPDSGVRVSSEFHHILTKVPEASYTISVDGEIDVVFRTELGYRVDHGVISSASDSRYFDTGKIYSSSDRKVTIPYNSSLAGQTIRYRYTVTPVKISPETILPEYVGSFQVTYAGTAAPMTYAITFDMNGHGTQVADQTVNAGEKATKPADPTASGYMFVGWYKDSAFNTVWNFDTDTVTENTTLYALWAQNIQKIIESINVNVTAPAVGSHPDYSPVITATPNEVTSLCKVYLTPEWICADTESDLYNGNGTVMTAADTFEAGKYYAFSIQVNTLDAIIAGWQRSSTIVVTINGSVIDSLNHNVLVNTFGEDIGWLRAAWKMPDAGATATYTVNFNMNGHGNQVADQTVNAGEKVTEPAEPTEIGYMFVGWYKDTAFTTPWKFETDTVTEDITLHALWALNIPPEPTTYTVSFNMGGHGNQVAPQTVNEGAKATKPTDPAESGWTFNGWYADATFSAAFDFDTAIAADTTIYAKWTANSVTPPTPANYTVTFNMNGHGTQVPAQTVEEGNKATKPTDPSASGYTFDGWYADATFSAKFNFDSAITANTTVYAKWTEVKKDEPSNPANPTKPADPTSPQTGDNSHLFLWIALLLISGGALAGTAVYGKKRKYFTK